MKLGIPSRRLATLIISIALSANTAYSAHASTTAFSNGTGWFDNFNLVSGQYFAYAIDVDAPFTVESAGILIHSSSTSADVTGSTITFYKGHPSSPTSAGNLLGTLTYASIATEASQARVTYTGSVSIPSAGRYWWKISGIPAAHSIWIHMGGYSGATGSWTAWNGTANWDQNGTISDSVGEYPKVLITGTAGASGGGGGGGGSSNNDESARKEAERARQEKVQKAQTTLISTLKTGGKIESKDLSDSELPYVSIPSLAKANADIAKLPEIERANLASITKVLKKYVVIESIASPSIGNVTAREMKEFKVIASDTPQSSLILWNLRKTPVENRDTEEKIAKYVATYVAEYQARKDRLAAVQARILARQG